MTEDERTRVRALLGAVSEDLPPTRLTPHSIIIEARRPTRLRRITQAVRGPVIGIAAAAAVFGAVAVGMVGLAGSGNDDETTSMSGGGNAAEQGAGAPAAGRPDDASARAAGVAGVTLAADGRTLTAVPANGCQGAPRIIAVRENTDAVWLTLVPGATPSPSPTHCEYATTGQGRDRSTSVRLDAPLGTRTVFDSTGRALAVLDLSKVRKLGYLPAGYGGSTGCLPAAPGREVTAAGNAPLTCTSRSTAGNATLFVIQGAGQVNPRAVPDLRTTSVGGTTAWTWTVPATGGKPAVRVLTWSADGITVTIESHAPTEDGLLPPAELGRIATGLR